MRDRWDDTEASEYRGRFADESTELALRIYTSRLIGQDSNLVLHGGGNTSVKSHAPDAYGQDVDVLHIKGSGWDLGSIEPAGLPAVRLQDLRELRNLDELSDEMMVFEQRRALLDPTAPNPSIEALLHAFLPHRFVDHSHADAILALTNQPDGEARVRTLYGERVAWVPYVMPGFKLAKAATEIYEKNPDVEGLVLERHGLFSFGDDARTSYQRHVALVDLAERHILDQAEGRRPLDARPVVAMREPEEVAPVLRGALAVRDNDGNVTRRWILEHRSSDEIAHFAASEMGRFLSEAPPITPDHVIRTKGPYLFMERPPYANLSALGEALRSEIDSYRQRYGEYFARNVHAKQVKRTQLDPTPRVVILPGVGLFAVGETQKSARVAADIAEHTIKAQIWATTIGHYEGLDESDLFDMEYWSLEQAKLGARQAPPLTGQVALVTGGAGAIGEGIATALISAGAQVVLIDHDTEKLRAVNSRLGGACETSCGSVTDEIDLEQAFTLANQKFGGVDLVVVNAGIARTGALSELDPEAFRATTEVNINGAFLTMSESLRRFKRQGSGGNLVLISTKNVFAPGAEFGAYSASKAGAHQLAKIAALEGAEFGVRVNMINADAIFGDAENPSGLWQNIGPERAQARGLEAGELPEYYRQRNLLKTRVTADHVANAVLFFARQLTPTTGATLPVDGGLPDAFPR